MKFAQKNNDGIEIHLELKEREILYKALEHYAAKGKPEDYVIDNLLKICEMEDVLYLPEFNRVST